MSQQVATTNNENKISCLLIPVQDKNILLPNVTVAEIISYRQVETKNYQNEWLLGQILWRETQVPVVSYELLSGSSINVNAETRIAIINGIGRHKQMPFFALVVQGIPKLVQVADNDMQQVEAMHAGAYDKMMVSLNNQQVAIPDLELIESELLSFYS